MVRGIGKTKEKKKPSGLTAEKDYITEAYLQGGKAVGEIVRSKNKKSNKK